MPSMNPAPIPGITSSTAGQWPVLKPTFEDLHWIAAKSPAVTRPIKVAQPHRDLQLHRRVPIAALKGAVIAALVVGIVAGLLPAQLWWLESWHWAGGLMIVGGLGLMTGFDTGLIALAAVADIQFVASLPAHSHLAAGLAALCIGARVVWELLFAIFVRS